MPTSHTQYPGVEAVKDHGLAGIPFLPKELADAFPPSQPVEVPPANARTVKQRFVLLPISCQRSAGITLICTYVWIALLGSGDSVKVLGRIG